MLNNHFEIFTLSNDVGTGAPKDVFLAVHGPPVVRPRTYTRPEWDIILLSNDASFTLYKMRLTNLVKYPLTYFTFFEKS